MDKINVIQLYSLCTNVDRKEEMVAALQQWGLVPAEGTVLCPRCGNVLKLMGDCSRADAWMWRCTNKLYQRSRKTKRIPCRKTLSFRTGTIFEKSKISIWATLVFIHLWVEECQLKFIGPQIEISLSTCVQLASFCREVILESLMVHGEKIGGPDKIVEIKKCQFLKRKDYRGQSVEGKLVFGGFERETGRAFMVMVEDKGVDTLLPVIERWINNGTTILSDQWKSLNCLNRPEYQNLQKSHNLIFEDAENGTSRFEASWRFKVHKPYNLATYMFIKRCQTLRADKTKEFFKLVAMLYNYNRTAENLESEDQPEITDVESD